MWEATRTHIDRLRAQDQRSKSGATLVRGGACKGVWPLGCAAHSEAASAPGPLLSPPLLGVRRGTQLRTIASGGGSAEVTFEARPPAVVGGAEVSPELESEVSPTPGAEGQQAGWPPPPVPCQRLRPCAGGARDCCSRARSRGRRRRLPPLGGNTSPEGASQVTRRWGRPSR